MRIDAAGRVGIGTSSPSSFDAAGDNLVVGTGSGNNGITVYSGTANASSLFFADGTGSAAARADGFIQYTHSNQALAFATGGGSEAMRIDSAGRVGIGVTPFSAGGNGDNLMIGDPASDVGAGLTIGATTTGDIQFGDANTGTGRYAGLLRYQHADDVMAFWTASDEAMRIGSSGNLLVGTTSTAVSSSTGSVTGTVINNSGLFEAAKTGTVMELNRLTGDGTILNFRKDGTTVGSIGTAGGVMYLGTGDTGILFNSVTNQIYPFNPSNLSNLDGVLDLGRTTARWKDVYRSGSTISTSDRNMKQDIRDLTDAERNVAVAAKGLLKAFRFIDTVAAEGDSANIHFGIIAQDLAAAFEAEGLDANDYQVYRADTFTDDDGNEQTRLGICYENLLAFIISAI
jgi:hypothetical protein